MKKSRLVIGLILLAAIVFAAGFGTAAYFSKTFSSNANEVKADEFVITSTGVAEGSGLTKSFSIDKFAPGDTGKYEFFIDRATTLPVKYEVTVTQTGQIPLTYSLTANGGGYGALDASNNWTVGDIAMNTANSNDKFILSYSWPYEGDSNAFIGKDSTISVTLKAVQLQSPPTTKYVKVNVTDNNLPTYTGQTTARITVDASNHLTSVSGYDSHLGYFNLSGTTLKTGKYTMALGNYMGPNDSGVHQFKGTINGEDVIVEILPN